MNLDERNIPESSNISIGTTIDAGTKVHPTPSTPPNSDALLESLIDSDPINRAVTYLDPLLKEYLLTLEVQVKSVCTIANEAKSQSDSARLLIQKTQDIVSRTAEQSASSQKIAQNSRSLALSLQEEVNTLHEQLNFAKKEAYSAKIDSVFAKIISVVSIGISLATLIANTP